MKIRHRVFTSVRCGLCRQFECTNIEKISKTISVFSFQPSQHNRSCIDSSTWSWNLNLVCVADGNRRKFEFRERILRRIWMAGIQNYQDQEKFCHLRTLRLIFFVVSPTILRPLQSYQFMRIIAVRWLRLWLDSGLASEHLHLTDVRTVSVTRRSLLSLFMMIRDQRTTRKCSKKFCLFVFYLRDL